MGLRRKCLFFFSFFFFFFFFIVVVVSFTTHTAQRHAWNIYSTVQLSEASPGTRGVQHALTSLNVINRAKQCL